MPIYGYELLWLFLHIFNFLQRQNRRKEHTMSMTTITIICRPTRDPELKTTTSGVIFTSLDVAVNKGYGEKEHPNYFRAFCKNETAQRIINAGVKKGSLIYITGDLDIRTYTKKDGTTGTSNDINVFDWGYVQTGKPKSDDNAQTQNGVSAAAQNIPQMSPTQTGSYNPYSGAQPQFEEISADDDLPF